MPWDFRISPKLKEMVVTRKVPPKTISRDGTSMKASGEPPMAMARAITVKAPTAPSSVAKSMPGPGTLSMATMGRSVSSSVVLMLAIFAIRAP